MLVVDDGSPDGTADLVKGVAAQLSDVHLLSRAGKSGLGSAYRAGFAWGLERGYDACIEIDADFSHDPAALPTLVAPLEEGFDVAIGSRYVEGAPSRTGPGTATCLSRGGNAYASAVLGLGVADSTAGYRAYSARILRQLDLDRIRAEGYGFQIEMTYRASQHGATITEVPISFVDRAAGESKMSSFIVCRGARPGHVVGPGTDPAGHAPCGHGRAAGQGFVGRGGGRDRGRAVSAADPTTSPTGTEDPVRSA